MAKSKTAPAPAAPAATLPTPAPIEETKEFDAYEAESEEQDAALAVAKAARERGEKPEQADAPSSTPVEDDPPAPAPAPKPKHNRRLLREARDFRIPESVIENTDSETLDEMVYDLRQRAIRHAQDEYARQQEAARRAAPKPEPESPFSDDDYKDWEPGTVSVLKKRDKVTVEALKELAAVKAELAEVKKGAQERETRDNLRVIKGFIGKNPTIFTSDAAGNARQEALAGYLRGITEPKGLEEDLEEGIKLLFGAGAVSAAPVSPQPQVTKPAPAPRDEIDEEIDVRKAKWEKGGTVKPTGRQEELPVGEKRFYQTLSRLHRAHQEQSDEDYLKEIGANGKD